MIAFTTSSGQPICSVVTNTSGTASCSGTLSLLGILLGGGSYHASFAGDALYNSSAATDQLLRLAP